MHLQIKKILVIRRDNIGDLACTTPIFDALRTRFPGAEIGALVNSYNAEVLRGNPNVDQVFVYQKFKHAGNMFARFRALNHRLKLIVRLRRWKPDVTILGKASYDRHGLGFARQIGAKNTIGYMPKPVGMSKGLPDICMESPNSDATHEVEAVAGLLFPLGITQPMGPIRVFPEIAAVNRLKNRLPQSTQRIALHISAREPERRWGIDNFITLTNHLLHTEPETQILLLWSPGREDDLQHPGDDENASILMQEVKSDRLIPMHTLNLTELIAALSLCELFIGSDGGAMHLAAGLNKRIVALFENTPYKLNHWFPWRVDCRVVHSSDFNKPEVRNIPVATVIASCRTLLNSY